MDRVALGEHRRKSTAHEKSQQLGADLALPADPNPVLLDAVRQRTGVVRRNSQSQLRERGAQRRHRLIEGIQQELPTLADQPYQLKGQGPAQIRTDFGLRALGAQRVGPPEVLTQRLGQFELVLNRQLNIDALDGIGVFAPAAPGG